MLNRYFFCAGLPSNFSKLLQISLEAVTFALREKKKSLDTHAVFFFPPLLEFGDSFQLK